MARQPSREEQDFLRELENQHSPEQRRRVRGRILRVGGGGTVVTLVSSSNPILVGSSVTFTATVPTPSGATGTVTFFDGATQIGTPQTLSGTPPTAAVSTS